MTTLIFNFMSNNTPVKKTAMFKSIGNGFDMVLSESRKNEAYDADIELYADGIWCIYFEGENGISYEIQMRYDLDDRMPTLEPIKAITWKDDYIDDVQTVTVKVK